MSDEQRIDLIWLGGGAPDWPLGAVHGADRDPVAVRLAVDDALSRSDAAYWLFWDGRLAAPSPRTIAEAAGRPGDVWHAGLRLGTGGLPSVVDFVQPTWMLNCDPDPTIEATSWRMTLGACLMRAEVLRSLGGPRGDFATLDGAALEMGHRYITAGARVRHVPWILGDEPASGAVALPLEDELRFAHYRFGRSWAAWAIGRALVTGFAPRAKLVATAARVLRAARPAEAKPLRHELPPARESDRSARITVLIPTLDRQEHLRELLGQLRRQTLAPLEIVVVDQTPRERRDERIAADFADLPLRLFHLDEPGQCSSRNLGIREALGDYILFLDDDDEVEPSLLETHVRNLRLANDEVSSGVAHEVGAGALPDRFRYARASDVLPTNNTLMNRSVLRRSGLFDLAYERGQRADGDLGMRVYLTGAMMVLNPAAAVLHHHAPQGGLRAHKARVVTYASSRSRVTVRHLPTATEVYLARRYFTPRQVGEALWLRVFGTFATRGGLAKKLLKAAHATLYLPSTLRSVRGTYEQAGRMLETFPRIASLEPARGEERRAAAGFEGKR